MTYDYDDDAGPVDSGLEFLTALSCGFTHPRAGLRSLCFLLLLSPLTGVAAVMRVCDLSALVLKMRPAFDAFFDRCRAQEREIAWLAVATRFYCKVVKSSALFRALFTGSIADRIPEYLDGRVGAGFVFRSAHLETCGQYEVRVPFFLFIVLRVSVEASQKWFATIFLVVWLASQNLTTSTSFEMRFDQRRSHTTYV